MLGGIIIAIPEETLTTEVASFIACFHHSGNQDYADDRHKAGPEPLIAPQNVAPGLCLASPETLTHSFTKFIARTAFSIIPCQDEEGMRGEDPGYVGERV